MSFQLAFWLLVAVLMFVVVPITLAWSMIEHFRHRGSDRKGAGGISAGIGASLMELDRIMARPSVEHQIDTEKQILKRGDDNGGEL